MTPERCPGRGAAPAPGRGFAVPGDPPDPHLVLVVCKAARRVDLLEATTLRFIASIELSGPTGHEVATAGGSGRAFVPIYGSGVVGSLAGTGESIDVLDLSHHCVAQTIALPGGAHPHDARALTDGRLVVTCEGRASLTVLDSRDGRLLEELRLPFPTGHMALVSPDGRRAWVVHIRPGVIVEVDLSAGRVGRHLHVSPALHRATLDAEGRRLFAAEQDRPQLAEVDLESMAVTGRIRLPGTAFGSAATPEGRHLLVALRERSSLVVLDLPTRRVVHEVPVPHRPQSVVVDPDGDVAYVTCTPADRVVAIDVRSRKVVASSRVGAGADGLALGQPTRSVE